MPVPEDRFTNSVSDAAAYERYRSKMDEEDDRPSLADVSDSQQERDEDFDDCQCSDPGCPCSGAKRGGPP